MSVNSTGVALTNVRRIRIMVGRRRVTALTPVRVPPESGAQITRLFTRSVTYADPSLRGK